MSNTLPSLAAVTGARLTNGRLVDLVVVDGVVTAVTDSAGDLSVQGSPASGRVLDVAGQVLVPGLVDAHVHLDKAYLLDAGESARGGVGAGAGVAGAIAAMAEVRQRIDAQTVLDGARRAVNTLVRKGVVAVRAHAEIDRDGGLALVELHQRLRQEFADVLDLQITAFPQYGLSGGVRADMAAAAAGAAVQVIAGCPYVEDDPLAHLDAVFGLADQHGLPVDLHLDFDDDPSGSLIAAVADRTRTLGMQGLVTIGHVTKLAAMSSDDRARAFAELADAGVALVVMPATDLYLGGAHEESASLGSRSLAPIAEAAAAGVRTAVTNNNIANDFAPYGNGSLIQAAWLAGIIGRLPGPPARALLLDAITTAPAAILGRAPHGPEVGHAAHLAVLDTTDPRRAIHDGPAVLATISGGMLTYSAQPFARADDLILQGVHP
ncbi:cytosine deaminase [Jatrophihabitans sp. GAS493]|uniref:amidohydrolase family protein n=1 Tax=Jatrophihabitans sp. GAS493 TaxID=1907575 RepID=UPI000BB83F25|nr:amidohydrolase family protein [Jatrophihabitans sp. GAS493]SOD70772.1 cytosine deaminase [Jatrophihabitans sp. GAS493]